MLFAVAYYNVVFSLEFVFSFKTVIYLKPHLNLKFAMLLLFS